MFTPKEVQEQTFAKAMFGGYDMASVDEFLEPLIEDYITLYKENSVLKSKMKILVEKLEDYRDQEESMKNAILSAQRTADEMVAAAEKRCAEMAASQQTAVEDHAGRLEQDLAAEEDRINRAKRVAQEFIASIEKQVGVHLEMLNTLKSMNLTPTVQAQPKARPYDYDSEPDPRPAAAPKPSTGDMAREIEQNLERVIGSDMDDTKPYRPVDSKDKFSDLQFGRNYTPGN